MKVEGLARCVVGVRQTCVVVIFTDEHVESRKGMRRRAQDGHRMGTEGLSFGPYSPTILGGYSSGVTPTSSLASTFRSFRQVRVGSSSGSP
jgi:hypothetical protein